MGFYTLDWPNATEIQLSVRASLPFKSHTPIFLSVLYSSSIVISSFLNESVLDAPSGF